MSNPKPGDRIECKNGRFLLFRSPLEEEEMIETVQAAVEEKRKEFPKIPQIEVYAHVRVANGAHNGYGYLALSDPEIGFWLLGLDLKGKPREKEIDDPVWSAKTKEELQARRDALKIKMEEATNASENWGTLSADETEAAIIDAILKKNQYPKVRRPLPPLLKLPTLECSEYQVEVMQGLAHHKLEEKKKEIDVPDADGNYDHYFEEAHVYYPPEHFLHHQLITAVEVPTVITPEMIKKHFQIFTTMKEGVVNGNKMEYPHVTEKDIRGERKIIVEFHPNSTDAMFALLFTKCFEFPLPKEEGEEEGEEEEGEGGGEEESVELRFAFNRRPPQAKKSGGYGGYGGRGGERGGRGGRGGKRHR